MIKLFQLLKLCVVLLIGGHCNAQDYQLVWSDEFNKDGCLDESIWNYEQGYARNEELQWYQSDNAWCQGGLLVIEARSEKRKNPRSRGRSHLRSVPADSFRAKICLSSSAPLLL